MYALINWSETHPVNGSVVRRSLSMNVPTNAEKVANALRDCAYVENVHVELYDVGGEKYPQR